MSATGHERLVVVSDALQERYGIPARALEPLIELIRWRRRVEIEDSLRREARGEPADLAYRRHNERALAKLGG